MINFLQENIFYILSVLSLIFTTIYLYYNKKAAEKFNKVYSFQLSFFSLITMLIFSSYEILSSDYFFNFTLGWIFILIIGLKLAIRTFLIESIIKQIDVGYFEIFMKFGLVFMTIFEYLFLQYHIPLFVYVGFIIFFLGLTLVLKFKSEKNLNTKNIGILLLISLLFASDPFLIKYIVENGYLSLSLTYFFELLVGTILIGVIRPRTVKFSFYYVRYFFPLAFIRMLAAYLAGMAILIGSPTIVELIKGISLLILFLISVLIENKKISLKSWLGIIISFIGVSLIIFFK